MRKLIEKDAEVKSRFDTDGNGHIDGDEWEQVRQLVIRRLEGEATEQAEAQRLAAEADEAVSIAAVAGGAIAQQIYDGDLSVGGPGAVLGNGISDSDDLILEQQGGLSQAFEGLMRRSYAILGADGRTLGTVEQVENELLQDLGRRSLFDPKELSFRLCDAATTETFTLQRSESLGSDQLFIYDSAGAQAGMVRRKPGLLSSEYRITSSLDAGTLSVKSSLFKPFSLEILGIVGSTIGTVQRGWSGLGAFVTGANRMRIHLDEPAQASPMHRIGLVAAALVADLEAEDRKR